MWSVPSPLHASVPSVGLLTALLCSMLAAHAADALDPHQQLAKQSCKELIDINTVSVAGDSSRAADAMAARLIAAGLPSNDQEGYRATLQQVIADADIRGTKEWAHLGSVPSVLTTESNAAIRQVAACFWPQTPIVPLLSSGATERSFLRNAGIPTYGFNGLSRDLTDNCDHGCEEQVSVQAFHDGHESLYQLVRLLSSPEPAQQ